MMPFDTHPVVNTSYGALRGQRIDLEDGGHYFSFKGIPYAKPPVGPLRFKVAEAPEPWQGVRDALQEGNSCPQIESFLNRPYRGNEDCLYLNVYTPQALRGTKPAKRPVLVWIHGGGFESGSGDAEYYGPDYLVAEDVVLVTFNYRLSIFGFINVDDDSVPANLGLKDQVAALRWVRDNIENFGGDANNVTIFGESAGGVSVNLHMLSPLSKGLFHKAIMQSGTVVSPLMVINKTKEMTFEVAKNLGCETTNIQELIEFLADIPAQTLVETVTKIRQDQVKLDGKSFSPVPECNVKPGDEIFLPSDARKMMENREFHSVPCMVGFNSQESIVFLGVSRILENPQVLEFIGNNLEALIPKDLESNLSPNEIVQEIKNFYFKNRPLTMDTLDGYLNLSTDIWFTRGTDQAVNILSTGSSPVFYYNFAFSGKRNLYKHLINQIDLEGAAHLDELGYLFSSSYFNVPEAEYGSREENVIKKMVKLWTSFAKYGNPTANADPMLNIQWPAFTTSNPVSLVIDDRLTIEREIFKERLEFWNKLS